MANDEVAMQNTKPSTMANDEAAMQNTKPNTETNDHSSPYYLHPSDYPRQIHVNDVLNDTNYLDWVQEMENFLFAKNKIVFVDGTLEKPEKSHSNHAAWLRCDAMIKGWLTATMEKEIRVSVKYANTAQEIWNDLRERFGKENASRGYEIKQLLSNMRQDRASVSTYYTRLRSLWDEMGFVFSTPVCSCSGCVCGMSKRFTELRDKERLYEFLLGLDNEYSTIRTQILAIKPTPTLGEAYRLVSEDEQQRSVTMVKKGNIDSAAFHTNSKKGGPASSQRHSTNRNKEKEEVKLTKETIDHCSFCDKDGHKREGCFKLVGYPDWWPGKKGEKAKGKAGCVETDSSPIPGLSNKDYQLFLKHFSGAGINEGTKSMANMALKEGEEGEWILDSGCTEYITYLSNILINQRNATFEPPVIIPNGDSIPVKGKGEYMLPGGSKINGVLYIPDFKCNLLSVSRLSRDLDCCISFFPNFCVMQGLQGRNLIGAGRCEGGWYRMKMVQERMAMATSVEMWHRRLGHASKGKQ